jgi:hypothetical protein
VSDVQAALAGDPAASSVAEIMLCYPGTIAIVYHLQREPGPGRARNAIHQYHAVAQVQGLVDVTCNDLLPIIPIGISCPPKLFNKSFR